MGGRSAKGIAAFAVVAAVGLGGCGGSGSRSTTTTNCPPGQVPVGSVGACAPPATSTPSSLPTQTTAASQSSGNTSPLRLGQSADFVGNGIVGSGEGEQASVTVQRAIDPATNAIISLGTAAPPPPAGQRYVGIELSIQSTGTIPYSDSPGNELSLISKSTGGPVGQAMPGTTGPGQCATDLSTSVNIAPGQTERGCVFFQVPTGQQLSAVQYQTQGGGPGYQATWNVP